MSIEIRKEFGTANLQAWKLRVIERNLKDKKERLPRSLYYSLGTELIEDGGRGLRRLSVWLVNQGEKSGVYPGSDTYKDLQLCFPKTAQRYLDEYSKIWAGIVLRVSEEVLCGNEDKISGMKICSMHNGMTEYTSIPTISPLEGIYPYIKFDERDRLLEAHKEDETNVSLIGTNINMLPDLLQEYLEYAKVVPNIKSRINPFATQIAKGLRPLQEQHNKIILPRLTDLNSLR